MQAQYKLWEGLYSCKQYALHHIPGEQPQYVLNRSTQYFADASFFYAAGSGICCKPECPTYSNRSLTVQFRTVRAL